MNEDRYRSRKFLITIGCLVIASGAAYFNVLSGELAQVLSVAIGSYNLANAWATK